MISREELELLISGAVSQAGLRIEAAHGRTLTRTETQHLGEVFATAMRMVADRCAASRTVAPPAPIENARKQAPRFDPARTQEMNPVTAEDIKRTLAGMSLEDIRKANQK